jgi:SOS response associated peptidase (SRAP)
MGSDPALCQRHQSRLREHQRPKAEGIENRPAFREAFQRRRCLVPVDNFYEWKKTATGKQPYAIALADRQLMALAGLWETWRSPAGERVRSFAIITTTPNELRGASQSDASGLKCGQSSAVGRYRAVTGGFDRPLPMLGAICCCLSRFGRGGW